MSDLLFRVEKLESSVDVLQKDINEIKTRFPYLATKLDLSDQTKILSNKIDSSVIGILKDTMNTFPVKVGLWIAGLGTAATIFGAVIGTLFFIKG